MKIQILSDLHLELHRDRGKSFIDSMDPTDVDVLVLPGDITSLANPERSVKHLSAIAEKYKHVVYVPGNHECWGLDSSHVHPLSKGLEDVIPNLHVLTVDSPVEIDGQRFVGDIGWYPAIKDPLLALMKKDWPDFQYISNFEPWYDDQNSLLREFIAKELKQSDIMVTHFLPFTLSVNQRWRGQASNCFFLSEFDSFIAEGPLPKLWLHGHTHDPCDYEIEGMRVVCNPRGHYQMRVSPGFKDKLVIEI